MKISNLNKVLVIAAFSALTIGSSGNAMANQHQWEKNHPRRAEVNGRLENQNKRIHQEVKQGEITKQQAANLHKEDHKIRREERLMASQNGGRITKQEQRTLNQQENAVSREIGK